MNISRMIFFGWYLMLKRTVYGIGVDSENFGPKEHSFLITHLLHSLNTWSTIRYIVAYYLKLGVPLYYGLLLCLLVFGLGYFFFFKKIPNSSIPVISNSKSLLFVIFALLYTGLSIYLMFETGNYVRNQLGN